MKIICFGLGSLGNHQKQDTIHHQQNTHPFHQDGISISLVSLLHWMQPRHLWSLQWSKSPTNKKDQINQVAGNRSACWLVKCRLLVVRPWINRSLFKKKNASTNTFSGAVYTFRIFFPFFHQSFPADWFICFKISTLPLFRGSGSNLNGIKFACEAMMPHRKAPAATLRRIEAGFLMGLMMGFLWMKKQRKFWECGLTGFL